MDQYIPYTDSQHRSTDPTCAPESQNQPKRSEAEGLVLFALSPRVVEPGGGYEGGGGGERTFGGSTS